ncbi:hypothetical protein CF326_g9292 [Tilletia indica]|nr:hypothetical protein CF326_g9292 [Tilletia indica]
MGLWKCGRDLSRPWATGYIFAFLASNGLLQEDEINALANVVASHDPGPALDALLRIPGWRTLVTFAREQPPGSGGGAAGGYGGTNDDEDADR